MVEVPGRHCWIELEPTTFVDGFKAFCCCFHRVTTLADGQGTRYRSEVNVKLCGFDSMTPEDVRKTIDTVIADPATASAVESKTIKLGMSPDEVKKSLGNTDKRMRHFEGAALE